MPRSTSSIAGRRGRAATRRSSLAGMVDGHGPARGGTRHAAIPRHAQPRSADGPARLSAPARRGRDGGRRRSCWSTASIRTISSWSCRPAIRCRSGPNASVFLYAGLPGEPAFGPPAFMHRMAIADSPEAPITHHWLDSTHITFGVVTAGVIVGDVKLEASRFNGREPDERRWNIETGPLDSTAVRLSWNPTPEPVAAGELGAADRARAAGAGREQHALVGERALDTALRDGQPDFRHARLGKQGRRRGAGRRGRPRPRPVDPLRSRRICAEQ